MMPQNWNRYLQTEAGPGGAVFSGLKQTGRAEPTPDIPDNHCESNWICGQGEDCFIANSSVPQQARLSNMDWQQMFTAEVGYLPRLLVKFLL